MLPWFGLMRLDAIAAGWGGVLCLSQTIEQLVDPTQTVEVKQMLRCHRGGDLTIRIVIGAAQGDGGVTPVRKLNDQVRIVPSANLDDLDPLAQKRMMWMGNGHKSRRRSG